MNQQELTAEEIADRIRDTRPISLREWAESTTAIEAAGFEVDACLLIHKDYKKRVQWLGNALAQMANRIPIEDDGALRLELGRIAYAFSYLLNSTSFEDGKLHDFDRDELDRKLGRRSTVAP